MTRCFRVVDLQVSIFIFYSQLYKLKKIIFLDDVGYSLIVRFERFELFEPTATELS